MATLLENANRIKTDKEHIRQAIISKGIDVPENLSLDDYDEKINEITAVTDKTVFKPHPNFIELKDYCYRRKVDGVWKRANITISDEHKYKCVYTGLQGYNSTRDIMSLESNFSQEYIDNFFPKFMGYYIHTHTDTNYKRTLDIVEFKYVNDSSDGLDNYGKDTDGMQFYNTISVVYSSASYQTSNSSLNDYYLIIKLTEDVGLLVYHTQNKNNQVYNAQYVRMFKVLNNKTISLYSSVTLTNASTLNTSERYLSFGCSINAPNQIFVLSQAHNYNTGVRTYTFRQLSCTTATHASSVTTCISDIRTTDSSGGATNVEFGTTSNYWYSLSDFYNDLAIFARIKQTTTTLDMRTYLGDNQTNAVLLEGYSFDNNSHPVSIPVHVVDDWRIYKNGIWHPELAGTSTYVDVRLHSYIKGRDRNGNFIATYYIYKFTDTGDEEILVQGKDYVINFDSTNFNFNVIKEL